MKGWHNKAMNTQRTKKGGFTIIEVVLVLAIAGLIFLMVFIALPALQRSQRDTQRRDDVGRAISQLTSYATNNRGQLPTDTQFADTFVETYLRSGDNEFNDPSTGTAYEPITGAGTSVTPGEGEIQYARGAECSGENVVNADSDRQAAVRVALESGGFYCQSMQ